MVWLSWIFAGIFFISVIIWNKRLRVAAIVINTTSKFLAESTHVIAAPLLNLILLITLTCFFMAGFWNVSSLEEVTPVDAAQQTREITWEARGKMIFLYTLIVYVWALAVCMSMNEFVITFSTINWYFACTLGEINALRKD